MRQLLRVGEAQSIDVLVDGEANNLAIVLLPSSQRDSFDFDAVVQALVAAGYKVLRPQPRGMGRSTAPTPELDLHDLALDVKLVIDRYGQGRAIVAGHAYGHFIARMTDRNHPAAVRGVALLAAGARTFPAGLTQDLDLAADATQSRADRLAALQRAFFAAGNDPAPWLEGWYPEWRDIYRRASATPPRSTWWSSSHAPILDLQGANDPWRPESTRHELLDVLADRVTVRMIPHASHALPIEQPAAVAAAIIEWARTLPR